MTKLAVTPHKWEIEEIDGGVLGYGQFWVCKACGASGGPFWTDNPPKTDSRFVFLPGTGLFLSASDCDKAKRQIARHERRQLQKAKLRSEAQHSQSLLSWVPSSPKTTAWPVTQYSHATWSQEINGNKKAKLPRVEKLSLLPKKIQDFITEATEHLDKIFLSPVCYSLDLEIGKDSCFTLITLLVHTAEEEDLARAQFLHFYQTWWQDTRAALGFPKIIIEVKKA